MTSGASDPAIQPYSRAELLALLALFVWLAGLTIVWLAQDRFPLLWDPAAHLGRALDFRAFLEDPAQWSLSGLAHVQRIYPPLSYLLANAMFLVLPASADAAALSNLLLLALHLLACAAIARRLLPAWWRVGAVALCNLLPVFVVFLHQFFLDSAVVVMTTTVIAAVAWSEGFRRRGPSLLAGLALGVGLLSKTSFVAGVGLPCLALLLAGRGGVAVRLGNLLLAGLVAALTAGWWYVENFSEFTGLLSFQYVVFAENVAPGQFWNNATYYLNETVNNHLLLPLSLMLGVLVPLGAVVLARRRQWSWLAVLLLWGGAPYVAYSAKGFLDHRYTMAALPALALLATVGLAGLPRPLRRGLAGVGLPFLLAQSMMLNFGWPTSWTWPPPLLFTRVGLLRVWTPHIYGGGPPRREHWPTQEVVEALRPHLPAAPDDTPKEVLPTLAVLFTLPHYSWNNFALAVRLSDLPVRVTCHDYPYRATETAAEMFQHDFLLLKDGFLGPHTVGIYNAIMTGVVRLCPEDFREAYVELGTWPVGDGSSVRLYQRTAYVIESFPRLPHLPPDPPLLLDPPDGAVLSAFPEEFRWDGGELGTAFLLEIGGAALPAPVPLFTAQPSFHTQELAAAIALLPDGDYWWQVRAWGGWSDLQTTSERREFVYRRADRGRE